MKVGTTLLTLLVAGITLQNRRSPAQAAQQTPSLEQQAQSFPDDQNRTSTQKQKIKHVKSESARLDWYSPDTEIKLGRERGEQVERSMGMVEDPAVNEYVDRIGENLVLHSNANFIFTFKVIASDEVVAFALPGGFLYVTSGMIRALDNEAELAGVMAHGIAHVAARHATRMMTSVQIANIASVPVIFSGVNDFCADCPVALTPVAFLKFSRDFEAEADYLGLQYMYNSGYDPNAFIVLLEKVGKRNNLKPGTLAASFATYPPAVERIRAARKEIAKILPAQDHSITNTAEFDQVKARLVALSESEATAPQLIRH